MLCILRSFPYRAFLPQDRHYCIGFKGNRCAVKQGGIYDYIAIFPSDLHQSSRLRDWKSAPGETLCQIPSSLIPRSLSDLD